jgi:hypothetical protein
MRLTISLRLSAIFGLLTALVLTLFGLYVYTQMRSDLTAAVDQGLQSRARLIAGAIPRLSRGLVTDTGVYGQPRRGVRSGDRGVGSCRGHQRQHPRVPPARAAPA